MKLKRMLSGLLSLAILTGAAAYSPTRDAQAADGIVLADTNGAAAIYIDPDGSEYDGISLAADAAAGDIEAVTGQRPEVVYELPASGVVIIAGVVNEEIITNEGLTWEISASNEDIKSEDWERYQIQVKEEEDLTKVIVAGADKRGTVYGLFHITQDLCGVSPWVWWADVRPAHKDALSFTAEELETVSIRPTVNYRGIFLNNEAPSLSAYVKDRFGNYNFLFYANVCELLLRLKANYLWPAMWGNVFPEEGVLDIDKAKDISNLDKLPESEREDRNWGMYYHFDMNGGAFSYKWINTVPLERIWDSMTTSYDYGIDDLWVVNVGDLKPLEFPISYFIDMGYDFDKWGTNNPNSTDEYTKMWIEQQFGSMLDENEVSEVADIVTGYADMNGRCKPEIIFGSTFSTTKYNEAQDELRKALELEAQAEKYKAKFAGTPLESAYFELVYHPAAG